MKFEKKPIWISQNGRKFYKPEEFDDDHLMNMITFLSRGIFNMSATLVVDRFDEDEQQLFQGVIENRVSLAGTLLDEAKKRGLT